MRITTAFASLSLVLVLGLAVGCNTTHAPSAAGPDPLARQAYPDVVAMGALRNRLVSGEAIVDHATRDQPMRVSVPVRITERYNWQAQYRFHFFDDSHRPVGETDWRFVELPAQTQVHVQGVAMDPTATRWRLELRPWELRPAR